MHLPMLLTSMRLFLSPAFFVAFVLVDRVPAMLAVVWCLFLVMEVSDFLDGYFARRMKLESELGKGLDPFADSISRLTYFICLNSAGILPVWILLILIYRDLGVSFIRLLASKNGGMMGARRSGKVKAWVYGICGLAGLAAFSAGKTGWLPEGVFSALQTASQALCYASGAVALWSLADYASVLKKS